MGCVGCGGFDKLAAPVFSEPMARQSTVGTPGTFSILLGGELVVTERLRRQIAGSRLIAADGGMGHAAALGMAVDLWVGDFDSSSAALQASYPDVPRQTHPADKDKTDGEIAIDAALALGATELVLVGALGGQTDHALGNLGLLLALAGRDVTAYATSGREEAYPLTRRLELDLPAGSRLSVIAFSPLVGLDISGVRWPLAKADVGLGSTWTLSNVALGAVSLGLVSGTGVVMACP